MSESEIPQYSLRKVFCHQEMIEAANLPIPHFLKRPEGHLGEIDLHLTGELGRGYEGGAIGRFYSGGAPPLGTDMEPRFYWLPANCDLLLKVIGPDLKRIAPIAATDFHGALLKRTVSATPSELPTEITGRVPVPAPKTLSQDVGESIIFLRATCHRLLHFGRPINRDIFMKLLRRRSKRLVVKEIKDKDAELFSYYALELAIDERAVLNRPMLC